MHHRTITPQEFVGLYAELRHPRQIELPGGFSQCGYHPIYGGCVTAHDGDRIGLILTSERTFGLDLPGRRSNPILEGDDDYARLVVMAGIVGEGFIEGDTRSRQYAGALL